MCGIGAVSLRSTTSCAVRGALEAINRSQLARGPDGAGVAALRASGVGMVRLRVRADRAEPEPIPLSDLRTAAYNGEVYWHDGAAPSGGRGEALALERADGSGADGMYAIAALDRGSGAIEIERDRFGIKPLYRRRLDDGLAVASTIAGLIEAFGRPAIRPEAVGQFIAFGRPIDGGTFFEGVSAVPRGSRWVLRDGRMEPRPRATPPPSSPEDPADLRRAVDEAVRRVLPSDRTIGLAVSGGLDSTILAHRLAALGVENLRTVSVRVEGGEDGLDDLATLRLTAPAASTWSHSATTVTPEAFARGFERLAADLGEPTRLTSAPLYGALADAARDAGIVVLLVGEGADELFMGYASYLAFARDDPQAVFRFMLPQTRRPYVDALLGEHAVGRMIDVARRRYPALDGETGLDRLRRIELDHSLEPLLLRADHILMARSIEGRTPFLHGNVPDLALATPAARHIRDGVGKALLRDAFPEIQAVDGPWRSKRPFRAPIVEWLRSPLKAWLDETLDDGEEALRALGLRAEGLSLVRADVERDRPAALEMAFSLMSLVFWRRALDGARPGA